MKTFSRGWLAALAVLAAAACLRADEYRLGSGDQLSIRVMDQKGMEGIYTVSPDGDIAFPMIGRLPVKGQTPAQVEIELTRRLADGFIRHPVLTVALERAVSRKFSIYGEVKTPGEFPFPQDGTSVLRAVSMAGGVLKGGSESKVRLLRPRAEGEAYEVINVDLKEVIDGRTPDPAVRDRDILIVREGWF